MPFSYTSNIPDGPSKINSTQNALQENSNAVPELIEIDHVGFNTADLGKHNKVSLTNQTPAPTFSSGEEGLYNFINTTSSKNELYVHKQTAAGTDDIPMTASVLSNTALPLSSTGWTYLPSGILLKWTTATATAAGTPALDMNQGGLYGPNYTTLVHAQVTATGGATKNVAVGYIFTGATINLYAESGTQTCTVFTIGY